MYEQKSRPFRTHCTTPIGHNVRMTEPKDRLRQARQAAGYPTPSDAARAIPRLINKHSIISHENGNREISRQYAEKYAEAFRIDPGWLLFGTTPGGLDVPLLSMVGAGNLRHQPAVSQHDVIGHIKAGDLPKGDWIALQVDGNSMDRIAPPGSIILVDRSDTVLRDGKYYVFSLRNGEATFKRWMRDPPRLQPYSTDPDQMSIPVDMEDLFVFGRVRRVIIDT